MVRRKPRRIVAWFDQEKVQINRYWIDPGLGQGQSSFPFNLQELHFNPRVRWRKITLIGVGLLGGSLGLALKRRALIEQVEGYVRREASIAECLKAGVVDRASCDLEMAVQGADIIVFCTPIAQMKLLARAMAPFVKKGALVTDVGSVKANLVHELEPICREAGTHFIGSHPMAGSEKMGVAAARSDLYNNAVCAITPTEQSPGEVVEAIEELWRSVGCRILRLTPEAHDELVSRSSHLPHLLASELAMYVLDPNRPPEQAMLCAGGFKDTTRVASGSPEMWRDIVVANRKFILNSLEEYQRGLAQLHQLVKTGTSEAIEAYFQQAKTRRDAWSNQGGSALE